MLTGATIHPTKLFSMRNSSSKKTMIAYEKLTGSCLSKGRSKNALMNTSKMEIKMAVHIKTNRDYPASN